MSELEGLNLSTLQIEPREHRLSLFSLALISPTDLELITHYLSGYDIASLYRTCSSVMIGKMSYGVQEVVISRRDSAPSNFLSFGSCLRACSHLKSLSLLDPSLYILQKGPMLFEYLPQTLETLKLHLPVSFGNFLLIDRCVRRKGSKKPRLAPMGLHERTDFPKFSLQDLFPRLGVLAVSVSTIKGLDIVRYNNKSCARAIGNFFKVCPSTLRSLELAETLENFARLPESIDTIGLTFGRGDKLPDDWYMLPENLVRMTLNSSGAETQNCIGLPQYLEKLDWIHVSSIANFKALDGLASHSSLLHLSLQWKGSTRVATTNEKQFFELLPQTLQTLKVEFDHAPAFTFSRLPPLLTDLSLAVENGFFCEGLVLPPSLRSLKLSRRLFLLVENIWSIPRGLVHLALDLASPSRLSVPPIFSDSSAEQCAVALPESIASLHITHSPLPEPFLAHLPKNLRTLEFCTVRELSANALSLLPEDLTSLSITTNHSLPARILDNLPAGLTELTLNEASEIDDRAISHLPRGLLHLTLLKNDTLSDACIRDLPTTLLTLTSPDSTKFSVMTLRRLPRFLQQLSVKSIIMTHPRPTRAQIIADIPPAIDVHALPWRTAKGRPVNFGDQP